MLLVLLRLEDLVLLEFDISKGEGADNGGDAAGHLGVTGHAKTVLKVSKQVLQVEILNLVVYFIEG